MKTRELSTGLALSAVVLLLGQAGWAADLYVPGAYPTIQAAITAAAPGDVIHVAAGNYAEYLTINKAVTLLGANAGVHPAVGTHPTEVVGTRGPESYLTNNGFAISPSADGITIDGFCFTGDGGRIVDTYLSANSFHLTNCIFDNDAVATTQGVIQFGGGSHTDLSIDYNLFQDQGDHTIYTGGGPYDRMNISWNKFNSMGESLFWTASVLVDGVIQGNELDGTIGGVPGTGYNTMNAGLLGNVQIMDNWAHDLIYSPFQVGVVGGSITNNLIERIYPYPGYYGYCFQLWGGLWGTAVSQNVTIEDNTFSFNDVPGSTYPVHGFDITPPDSGPGVDGSTIVFRNNSFLNGGVLTSPLALRHRGDSTHPVDAATNWWGDPSGPYHAVLNPTGLGGPVGNFVSFVPWISGDYALIQTPSALHISSGAGSPTQTVVTYSLSEQLVTAPDWFSCTAMIEYESANLTPVLVSKLYNPTWSHVFQSNVDNNPSGLLEVTLTLSGLSQETGYTGDLFSVTFTGTGDNSAARIRITNCVLRERPNTNIAVGKDADEFIWVDGTVPTTPLALRALPRHNGVYLSWTPPTPAPAYYRIYRAPRTGYPWCPNLDLPPMATRVLLSGTIPGGQSTWTDNEGAVAVTRDVYDYHLVAVDEVENASAASATASATNYFLGDWADYNGLVDIPDLVALSTSYGTVVNCGVNGELDVAPTSDMGSFGLPSNHDGLINFEDLIIFAMNYGVALEPLLAASPVTKDPGQEGADAVSTLTLSGDESGIVLSLDRELLGFSALLRTERELVSAELEDGLALFYRTAGGYRVDVAGLGSPLNPDRVVRLTFAGQGPLSLASAESRDLVNGALATGVLTLGGLDALPLAFELAQNVPNPFNPVTTIRYTLPEEAGVRLALYNALGQEVMVLVQGPQTAGRHEARLDASGLASGVYIYRLEAGPFVDQRKMILVK